MLARPCVGPKARAPPNLATPRGGSRQARIWPQCLSAGPTRRGRAIAAPRAFGTASLLVIAAQRAPRCSSSSDASHLLARRAPGSALTGPGAIAACMSALLLSHRSHVAGAGHRARRLGSQTQGKSPKTRLQARESGLSRVMRGERPRGPVRSTRARRPFGAASIWPIWPGFLDIDSLIV